MIYREQNRIEQNRIEQNRIEQNRTYDIENIENIENIEDEDIRRQREDYTLILLYSYTLKYIHIVYYYYYY